jgi:hypothetical protein
MTRSHDLVIASASFPSCTMLVGMMCLIVNVPPAYSDDTADLLTFLRNA